jgi:hypothetical protein
VHCRGLTFTTYSSHVKAHQDDKDLFSKLSRKAQLNCICDHVAKVRIVADGIEMATPCRMFPLKTIGLFVGGQKMTTETGDHIQFWAHCCLAREYYKILPGSIQPGRLEVRSQHSSRSTLFIPAMGLKTCARDSRYYDVPIISRQ